MKKISSHILCNHNEMELTVLNYGAIIQSLRTKDGTNLVLGFSDPQQYFHENHPYFGALIGRLANRVAGAQFTIDNRVYLLEKNEKNIQCLHSGSHGLQQVFWTVQHQQAPNTIQLTYHSPSGEGGFPGTLDILVTYTLTDHNEFIIEYEAKADQTTPLDLTNHTYWNLRGQGLILEHRAIFHADAYLVTNADRIPTGEIASVKNTPLDFSTEMPLGERLEQLHETRGYDHYFLSSVEISQQDPVATIFDPHSGRRLNMWTSEPGFQFYTGNFLEKAHQGLCIETHNYPNAINQPSFPSPLLYPSQIYRQRTIYQIQDPS